ncbi:phosphodiester glycosidase family protein [Prosthecobacter vanneervenii]|uniref:Uncharacterized protein YigE (DUF2233 family) n=1 Tax=Prosthecobacter vanneervenii TaxID=48466 RepID=A0A7W8DK93_9BACT|nr:phosphodiester glycosidase family protein [Prosthecobacter vanneervenii]MBB5032988.1 uncharacterized protein YigE (DUF2233 family) [Prosthecobacter vanneervenii]
MKRALAFILTLVLASCATTPPPRPLTPTTESESGLSVPGTEEAQPAQPAAPPSKAAEWTAISDFKGQPLFGNASLIEYKIGHKGHTYQIRVVVFDSRQFELKVIDQPNDWAGGSHIKDSLQAAGAIAGVNGGFFSRDFKPMGLMIADGRKTGEWQTGSLLTGAVAVTTHPQIQWNHEVSPSEASQFLQAGPRLVDDGQVVPGLDYRKQSARTFIANDGSTQWLIGTAEEITLSDLGDLLSTPGLMPAFTVHRALNLDGGHSSAIYYRTVDGHERSYPGWSTVRNYLGIVPR